MHQLKEANMMSTKLDLIMKKYEEQNIEKKEVMRINDSRMTCEECGDVGHSGNNCPTIQEDVNYIINNNNYHPLPNQGWNQQKQGCYQQQQRPNYQDNFQGNF
jgi:hypothetical protein